MLTEHSIVALNSDITVAGLHAGDVGAIVHVHGQGKAYEVEFVDGDGMTIALLTLDAEEVRPIAPGELLHARRLALAKQTDEREPEEFGWLASLGNFNARPRDTSRSLPWGAIVTVIRQLAATVRSCCAVSLRGFSWYDSRKRNHGWARKELDGGVLRYFRWRWAGCRITCEGDACEPCGGACVRVGGQACGGEQAGQPERLATLPWSLTSLAAPGYLGRDLL